jgi:hypothetical protein
LYHIPVSAVVNNYSAVIAKKGELAHRFRGLKADKRIGPADGNNGRKYIFSDADMAKHAAAALSHADCFRGTNIEAFLYGGGRD